MSALRRRPTPDRRPVASAARKKKIVRSSSAKTKAHAEVRSAATRSAGVTKKPKATAARAASPGRTPSESRPRASKRASNAPAVLERLARAIPDPHVELVFENPWQLLVAVILSAQSTDRTVNRVTPELFSRWPTPAALAAAASEEVEEIVKPTGFFRNKTKAIRAASHMLVERFGGEVPRSMQELLEVPGVARKSANVVLGAAYGIAAGIVTDTHAMRVAQRLGLTREQTPEKIEADLCRQFPQEAWIAMSHRLVLHGRHLCVARAPACPHCPLNEVCPSRAAAPEGTWEERAAAEAAEMRIKGESFARPARAADRALAS